MALTLEKKKEIVEGLNQVARGSLSAVAVDYRGLSVAEMTAFRTQARSKGVYVKIVRNTLSRRALESTDFACLNDVLAGPILLAFSQEDPGSAARVVRDFLKEYEDKLIVRGLAVSGQLLQPDALNKIAKLPTRDEALALLMSVMKAPITKLAQTMNEINAKMVRVVSAVGDKKKTEEGK